MNPINTPPLCRRVSRTLLLSPSSCQDQSDKSFDNVTYGKGLPLLNAKTISLFVADAQTQTELTGDPEIKQCEGIDKTTQAKEEYLVSRAGYLSIKNGVKEDSHSESLKTAEELKEQETRNHTQMTLSYSLMHSSQTLPIPGVSLPSSSQAHPMINDCTKKNLTCKTSNDRELMKEDNNRNSNTKRIEYLSASCPSFLGLSKPM